MAKIFFQRFGLNVVSFRLFAAVISILILISSAYLLANNIGAIIISGSTESAFGRDVSHMTSALTNTSVGYGVSSSNVYSGNNISFADFQSAISQMNSNGVSELHFYISTHGSPNDMIKFSDGWVSKNDFISAIGQSTASTKHVVLDACYSGKFYNDLKQVVGEDGTAMTSTDENHTSRYFWFGSSFYSSTLTNYMEDPDTDKNSDGKVTYDEALDRLKSEGGWLPNLGHPKSASIPTLSEWKKIFLTLLMLSFVVGFTRNTHSTHAFSSSSTMFRIIGPNMLAFNSQLFYSVLKWVGVVVILGLAGATVIFGHVSVLDITGTLFCAPLVAYILHLVFSFVHDIEITS